ncbi:gamma carbonic anhydrase family protein [Microvirga aerophila]|uniref:Gamma carbonic anhydrase family protein n=1 Tax=Microvirga aerophila TaxID=670291 RepID=A0A512BXN8_9HYPH|nr:gamma carbonic anhydrase family protein [Microvirga aerophila]GEO16712.1 hypothetical protein MAE02_44080 [Microvirga aerophila]
MPLLPFEGQYPVLAEGAWTAPDAKLIGRVRLRDRANVWYGAVLRGDEEWIDIGEGSNVQDNCVLHTDPGYPLTVEGGCTIGHGAILHGCRIGRGALIGMGAIILNGADIGPNCLIGAGALIAEGKVIPARSVVIGSPGRVVRDVRDDEMPMFAESAEDYVHAAERHAQSLWDAQASA